MPYAGTVITYPVTQCFRLLARAKGGTSTSDALMDKVLAEYLMREQPDLWKWMQERRDDEDKMVASLAAQAPPPKKAKQAA